uniref:Secreted protein n=1 Tax=Oryza sativa subsp. japonica TaxID=39947 RepID=Q7F1D3_ORYSJ|nr:hypothetical protein [Oryza sativa Japonica Group]BAD03872.1 hypothetical protein [Oryza sativa Japonica Group]
MFQCAAVCLCLAIKASVLGDGVKLEDVAVDLPLLVNYCGRNIPLLLPLPFLLPSPPLLPSHLAAGGRAAGPCPAAAVPATRDGGARADPRHSSRLPWSDGLLPKLLGVIFKQLNCLVDRIGFTAVYRPWRTAAAFVNALHCGLPWLLLPSHDTSSYFSLYSDSPASPATSASWKASGTRACAALMTAAGSPSPSTRAPWRGFAAGRQRLHRREGYTQ